jgi:hypothetical protein
MVAEVAEGEEEVYVNDQMRPLLYLPKVVLTAADNM